MYIIKDIPIIMKWNKTIFWVVLFSCNILFLQGFSQKIMINEDVSDRMRDDKWGPNKRYFGHWFASFGPLFGKPETKGSKIVLGSSWYVCPGLRFKYKVNAFYSLVSDYSYKMNLFRIKQHNDKQVPNKILNDQEKLTFHAMGLNIYNRFNFGKRGNHLGKYIDLGVYGNWNFSAVHVTKNDINDSENIKTKRTGMDYYEPISYGLTGRIGVNYIVLFCHYRSSNIFTKKSKLPELPRFKAGLELGLRP